ncbi:hypothetical protein Tco_0424624 [Tanacetum coccineum]
MLRRARKTVGAGLRLATALRGTSGQFTRARKLGQSLRRASKPSGRFTRARKVVKFATTCEGTVGAGFTTAAWTWSSRYGRARKPSGRFTSCEETLVKSLRRAEETSRAGLSRERGNLSVAYGVQDEPSGRFSCARNWSKSLRRLRGTVFGGRLTSCVETWSSR